MDSHEKAIVTGSNVFSLHFLSDVQQLEVIADEAKQFWHAQQRFYSFMDYIKTLFAKLLNANKTALKVYL